MRKKKKVLFVANTDYFVELFLLPYLKMFQEKGYETHVATNTNKPIAYCNKKIKLPIERSPLRLAKNAKSAHMLKKTIAREGYEVIHCHTPIGGAVARIAAKKARRLGTRVIYTAHGFHFFSGAPIRYWMTIYPVEKYLAKYTDTLITINQEDYDRAKKKFGKRCKDIHYIPGVGVDENRVRKSSTKRQQDALRKSLGIKDNDVVLICIGRLDANKNQGMIIGAMHDIVKTNKNCKLLLVGADELNGKYKKQANGLEDNIVFTGFQTNVSQYLQISDILVSTSKREGLPVNVLEAMCCGLPCIVTDCRGNRDLVKNGHGGVVVPVDSTSELAKAVEFLCRNADTRKGYGEFNLGAAKKYKLEYVRNQYEEIYFKRKTIVYVRSTSIYNDPRAQKEILALQKHYNVLVLGWDREQKYNNSATQHGKYTLFNKKSQYGAGIRNALGLLLFQRWIRRQLLNTPNVDCIYACDFDTAYTCSRFAKKHRKKLVYDIFDYYVDCRNMPAALRNIIESMDIKTINNADLVVICSEERLKQIGKASPRKVAIIHNSIDLGAYKIKEHHPINSNSDKTKIAYVGILQENRLLKEVGREISNNSDLELHIGGFGQYANYFRDLSKKSNNVFFYGELEYPDVLSLEKYCDILFATYNPKVPNHRYSAPNKVYEAISLRKPIIVCKNTGVDKMVIRNNLGTAIAYDGKEFVRAVKNLKISSRFGDSALEKYGWKTMEKRLLDRVEEVLG